jgi:hypothetical protein
MLEENPGRPRAAGTQHWMTLIDYLHRDKGIDRFVVIMIEENLTRKKLYSISAC